MALFNYATRELSAKIVYYGPGLSGKTTNIEMVHRLLRPEQKGRLISLPTETDRTLFFDFLPVELGKIKGFKVRFHLYTVPGQVFYNATRRLVLQGVDGVVFVADSQAEMAQSNVESLNNLIENLGSYGKKLEELPFVMQYNKRDLTRISSVDEMNARLNFLKVPAYEGIAKDGIGVSDTLVAISRMVFSHLRKTLLMPGEAAEHEEIGEMADARLRKTFRPQEPEPLEEITDLEMIQDIHETARGGAAKGATAREEIELEGIEFIPDVPPPVTKVEPPPPEPPVPEPPAPRFRAPEVPEPPAPRFRAPEVPLPEPPAPEPPAPKFHAPKVVEFQDPEVPVPETPAAEFQAPETPGSEIPAPDFPVAEIPASEIPEPETPSPEPGERKAPFADFEEFEIEIPERTPSPAAPPAPRAAVSVETEEGGLTFLKFENPFVTPEGHAVLPAMFMDGSGNIIRLRIRITMEEPG